MERSRARTLSVNNTRERSDSRKRSSTEANVTSPTTSNNRNTPKKIKRVVKDDKALKQAKLTAFHSHQNIVSENESDKSASFEPTQTRMATNNEQFQQLMCEFQKMNVKFDEKFDQINQKLDERIEKVEGKVHDIEQSLDKANSEIKTIKRNIEVTEEQVTNAEFTANLALTQSERNEQFLRNYNIRIFNLPENAKETIFELEQKVLSLFSEKLNIHVPIEAIDNLHRMGAKNQVSPIIEQGGESPNNAQTDNVENNQANGVNQDQKTANKTDTEQKPEGSQSTATGTDSTNTAKDSLNPVVNKPRPVIISFVSRRVRREILANRRKLKKNPGQKTPPIIITEDLTKNNHILLSKAKENTEKFSRVWSKDGVIIAKQHNGMIVRIHSMGDVTSPPLDSGYGQSSLQRYKKSSLTQFLNWGSPWRGRGNYRGGRRGMPARGRRFHSRGFPSAFQSDDVIQIHDESEVGIPATDNRFSNLQEDDKSDSSMKWQ